LDRYEEALGCFDKALELNPRDTAAWTNKGASLLSLGRFEEALGCYDKALEFDPHDVGAWFSKALTEDTLGQWQKAVVSYQQFLAFAPARDAKQIEYARKHLRELGG
jgi:tetratricopeptide (TPR) repeat protein